MLAGILLPELDDALDEHLPAAVSDVVFGGGADAARTVLDAIASSLITVTSLTFSLTVVTLQLASSQFSPRLLRTFTRDRFVHVTLAVFLATFTFALTVLRSVRSASETAGGTSAVVPQISVTLAFVLAIASVVSLVLFLAHLAREIRVETMLATVHTSARDTADRLHPRREGGSLPPPVTVAAPPSNAVVLPAASSGFLDRVDDRALYEAACELDVTVAVIRLPGASVVAGTPLAHLWTTRNGATLLPDAVQRMQETLDAAVVVSTERTEEEDVAFGLRQLTDVAAKALSPGVNDPTTAVHALGHSSAFLCELVGRDLGDRVLSDEDGTVRVVLTRPSLPDLLDLGLTQPRRYGAADPLVLGRIADLLHELAWVCTSTGRRDLPLERATGDQLRRLTATAGQQDFDDVESAILQEKFDAVRETLLRSTPPTTVGTA